MHFANCIFLHAGFLQSVCNIQTPEEAAKLIGEFFFGLSKAARVFCEILC